MPRCIPERSNVIRSAAIAASALFLFALALLPDAVAEAEANTSLIEIDAVELAHKCAVDRAALGAELNLQDIDVTGAVADKGMSPRPFVVFENSGSDCQVKCEYSTSVPDESLPTLITQSIHPQAWAAIEPGSIQKFRGRLRVQDATVLLTDCVMVPEGW
jgi:hypothetical protein